ncbi:unnamed protein product [Peronospora farinosa]|uniref:Uncharacterized protein n=1 Tax=Peronospora farinosa TaxID=134698 RepID=A0AAV0SQP0_9STRA|nr:unnamed protein product [Peronospora farinosa]CAI5705990.1 unnamed protein product [Peronospora farinosa]
MASTPENVRNLALGSKSPASPPTSPFVLPPLPPLPPIDISQSPDALKQASESAVWSETRPMKFGTTQKYNHQHQCFLSSGVEKSRVVEETQRLKVTLSGRTIWSISPEELSELAKDMAETKKESAESIKKLSYAEASKRCLSGTALIRAMQPKVLALEQPIRSFKKYYGLPNIPSFEPLHRQNFICKLHYGYRASRFDGVCCPSSDDAEASEEKAIPFDKFTDTEAENESHDVLDNSQVFGLSATTPTFYPRQTTDTNELIQMVRWPP